MDTLTIYTLAVFCVGTLCALAFRFDWRLRVPFLLAAAAFYAAISGPNPTAGDYGGLWYILSLLPTLIAVATTSAAGAAARRAGIPTRTWTLRVLVVASVPIGILLVGEALFQIARAAFV